MDGVAITGANGHLGRCVSAALALEGYRIVEIAHRPRRGAVSLKDRLGLREALQGCFCLIHLATNYGRNNTSMVQMMSDNVCYPLQIMELVADSPITLVLDGGSGLPVYTNNYSLSKEQFWQWLYHWGIAHNRKVVGFRMQHFYGPGGDTSNFITRMIRTCLTSDGSIPLTSGHQCRDFVHVDDIVRLFKALVASPPNKSGLRYDVGYGQSVSVRTVLESIHQWCNATCHLDFGAVPLRAHEPLDLVADIAPLRDLGWKPSVDWRYGIQELIENERKAMV